MTPKNPLDLFRDIALDALKDPRGTAEKAVDQARGTAALGWLVANQVGRTAVVTATRAVGSIVAGGAEEADGSGSGASAGAASSRADLRPVPAVNEPAHPTTEPATAVAVDAPAKQQGDPTAPNPKSPARKATAKKSAAKKAPADTAAAKKAAAADTGANKATAKKAAAKKTAKSAPLPATSAADAGEPSPDQDVDATPADVAKAVAKRSTAKKTTTTKKAATAKKATSDGPAKKAAKRTTRKTAKKAPGGDDTLVYTSDSSDGPGNADDGDHLEQPLLDAAAVKAVASEASISSRAADPDKG